MMDRLMAYDWPGNVRELRNVLERAVITSPGSVLHLPAGFESESPERPQDVSEEWHSLEEAERRYILKALDKTGGRIEGPGGAAELLQLKPSTLRFRIHKLGIKRKKIAEHLNEHSSYG
jgi:formate hydrogenlyase transcriptional activator